MRWVNKLSDTDIEKLLKKLGVEYESLKIVKHTNSYFIYLNDNDRYYCIISDLEIITICSYKSYELENKIFYLFMENKFGKEYLIDLIRNKTGLSGKFLRKKLR